jgi:hypothetical protein
MTERVLLVDVTSGVAERHSATLSSDPDRRRKRGVGSPKGES